MIKKILGISLVAAFMSLFFAIPFTQAVEINPNELLRDAMMQDQNMDNWRPWGRMPAGTVLEKIQTENLIFDGPPAMFEKRLHLRTLGTNGGVQQVNVPVLAGHTYVFTFNYDLSAGTIRPLLGIHTSNSDFEGKTELVNFRTVGDSKIGTYVRYFTVPNNFAGDFRALILLENGEATIAWPSLREVTPEYNSNSDWAYVDYNRIVRDPFMSMSGTAHWRTWGAPVSVAKISEPFALPGGGISESRLHVDARGTSAGAQQAGIPLQAGKYRVTFSYKIDSGVMTSLLGMADSNRDFERKQVVLRSSNQWQDYTRVFEVPTATKDFRTVFIIKNGQGSIDNVMIEPIPNIAAEETGSLRITSSADFAATPRLAGSQDAPLGDFDLTAGPEEDVLLQNMRFTIENSNNDQTVWYENYRLQTPDGQRLVQGQLIGDQLTFNNIGLTIPRGQTVTIHLMADVQLPPKDPMVQSPDIIDLYLYSSDLVTGVQTVDAIGTMSGTDLKYDHVTYGRLMHADQLLVGSVTTILYTTITQNLGVNFNDVTAGFDEPFMQYSVVNSNNPTDALATLGVVKMQISSQNFDFVAGNKVRIYRDHVAPEQLLGSADITSVEPFVMEGRTYRNINIDIGALEIASGDSEQLIVTLDLQNAAPIPGNANVIEMNILTPGWSDGRSQEAEFGLNLIQLQVQKVLF
ncbi:hypothetical protein KBD59_05175 [Candidatus Gracilibacteria bacterium]|nr:hypothetical protein [Candidatus Gracilibacteria bacterium]